jgi:drug/metabolite transporter (DMT)-like permease
MVFDGLSQAVILVTADWRPFMINAAAPQKSAVNWMPYIILAIALCFMSTGAVFVRLAQAQHIPSLAIATLRYIVAVSILTPITLTRSRPELRRITRREFGLIALAGITFALALLFFFFGLEHTTVLIDNLFTNTHPLWVALVEVAILKVVLNRRVWLGLILALAGAGLFAFAGSGTDMGPNPTTGILFAFGSALLSTVYFILGRTVRARISTVVFLWIALTTGLILLLVAVFITRTPLLGYSLSGYFWILMVTITGQLIGQALMTYSLAHLPATFVSVSMLAQVILSAVQAAIIFGEQPGPVQLIGSAVVLAGVALVITARTPQAK